MSTQHATEDSLIAVDVETTGLRPYHGDRIFSYSLTRKVEGQLQTQVYRSTYQGFTGVLGDIFNGPLVPVFHNAVFDLAFISQLLGAPVWEGDFHDTIVLSKLCYPKHYSHALDDLTNDLFKYPRDQDRIVSAEAKKRGGMHRVPKELMDKYQFADGERTWLLVEAFYAQVVSDFTQHTTYLRELDSIRAALEIQDRGAAFDQERAEDLVLELSTQVEADEQELAKTFNVPEFNVNAPGDRERVILKLSDLTGLATVETESGKTSSSKDWILEVQEKVDEDTEEGAEAARLLTHFRRGASYKRGVSTLKGFARRVAPDGLIHPSVRPWRAVTGRWSVSDPPITHASKDRSATNPYPVGTRGVFLVPEGYVFIYVDFSGQEMRLLTAVSKEPELIKCYEEGGDAHAVSADCFYGDRWRKVNDLWLSINRPSPSPSSGAHDPCLLQQTEEVKRKRAELRDAAKNGAFSLSYGAGITRFARTIGVSVPQGAAARARWKDRFPLLSGLLTDLARNVEVKTLYGRRIPVPPDTPHAALDYVVQGTGADILKIVVSRLRSLHRRIWRRVYLVITAHDEVVTAYPIDDLIGLPEYLDNLNSAMTEDLELPCPMVAEFSWSTTTWKDKADLDVPKVQSLSSCQMRAFFQK